MKKQLFALAAGSMFSCAVFSQSNVTLYGIIDEGVNYNSNAGGERLYNLSSGVLNGSRWGLKGREDLGGGLAAIFTLESGFDVNSGRMGQGGLLFGRQAYVGLTSPYGTVTLGRQYDLVVDNLGQFEVGDQWGGYMAAHPSDLDNFNNTNRVNNEVKYTSKTIAGFTFGGAYSLSGVAGNVSRNQIWSLGANYANGPLLAGVGYLNVRNPNVSFYGNGGSPAATTGGVPGSNLGASPVISGYASAHTLQVIGAGGAYTFGAATFGFTYSNTKFMSLGDRTSGPVPAGGIAGTATFNIAEANFKYQITPALVAGVAYVYTHNGGASGHGSAIYNQGSAGLDYFLSKRTDVYTVATFQEARGTDSTGRTAVASINQLTPSTSNRQVAVRLGIRHKF
jgi:predicted porin